MNNTSKLLYKVLSKLTNELDARDIDKIMNDDDDWHIRQLLLDMESKPASTKGLSVWLANFSRQRSFIKRGSIGDYQRT